MTNIPELEEYEFCDVTQLETQSPTGDFKVIGVTDTETFVVTFSQFMTYLNSNLSNFICWKPVVTDNQISFTRSSNDTDPGIISLYLSPYDVAVKNGYSGTENEWLQSLNIYQPVTTTTDGLMTAVDKTTFDTMSTQISNLEVTVAALEQRIITLETLINNIKFSSEDGHLYIETPTT